MNDTLLMGYNLVKFCKEKTLRSKQGKRKRDDTDLGQVCRKKKYGWVMGVGMRWRHLCQVSTHLSGHPASDKKEFSNQKMYIMIIFYF